MNITEIRLSIIESLNIYDKLVYKNKEVARAGLLSHIEIQFTKLLDSIPVEEEEFKPLIADDYIHKAVVKGKNIAKKEVKNKIEELKK